MMPIKPIKLDNYNCYDAAVISILNYYNKEYDLMFLNNWFYEFSKEDNALFNKAVGGFVNFDILREYYGVDIRFYEIDSADFTMLEAKLSQKIPIIADVDAFYCHWNKAFKKKHIYHICVIIDIQIENEMLICIDPYATEEIIQFKFTDFIAAFSGAFWEVHNQESCKAISDFSVSKIFKYLSKKLDFSKGNCKERINVVDCINKNSGYYLGIFTQYDSYEDLYNDPLIINLKNIENSRINIRNALNYYLKKTNIRNAAITDLINKMNKLIELWKKLKVLIIRDIVRNNDYLSIQTKDILAEIGELEVTTYDMICSHNISPTVS